MKTTIAILGATALLFTAMPTRAGVIAGPITNPGNGHDYYLLTPNSWSASEAEAENLGGTLAIVKNAAENEWVFSKFGTYGGTDRDLWIGLHRQRQGGPFVWVSGGKLDYLNWEGGQPDNAGGVENCVEISQAEHRGAWNDANENQIRNGVVEVPGKTNEKSLTENEKALIGTWYASGDHEHPCWIAGTGNKLFQIYDGRATRLIFTVEGPLFLANGIRGEIVKDRILWSNGTWWSRKPAEYQASEKTLDADMPKPSSGSTTD